MNPTLPPFIQAQLPPGTESKFIEVDEFRIHYLERGIGKPVFMMHGNPTWSFLYRNIMLNLDPEIYRCIVPDLVGLGFSQRPSSASFHTLENHQRVITHFLDALIEEDFLFVGQDWGGPIGMLASRNTKSRMAGLVLLNTMIRPPKPDFKPTAFHKFSRIPVVSEVAFRLLGYPQKALEKAQGFPASISGDVKRAYTYPLKGLNQNAAPLMLARMVPNSHDHPSVPLLKETEQFAAQFAGPAGLFWGKRDPILGRLASAHQKILPNAAVKLTGGGHFIQEEYPAEIASLIAEIAQKAF